MNNNLHPSNKNKIDIYINNLKNIKNIYGGQTNKNILEKQKDHEKENKKF